MTIAIQRNICNAAEYNSPKSPLAGKCLREFLGNSAQAQQIRALLEQLCGLPVSAIVITGETGTGKGLAARLLHEGGCRQGKPLVEVNCAALPHNLLESELFGYEVGAFSGAQKRRTGLFEQAAGGTLFLDEIGEMPIELQAKLLHVLEGKSFRRLGGERELHVDVQIISATNCNITQSVAQGTFRADLYYRLSVFNLQLPPLRARICDVKVLAEEFLATYTAQMGKRIDSVPEEVWKAFGNYSWPGNVRELRNVIERGVLLAATSEFPMQSLELSNDACFCHVLEQEEGVQFPMDGSMTLDEMEAAILSAALRYCQNNVSAAARLLGMTRERFRYRLQKQKMTGVA